jgi:uncharacterized protein YeaO (DUF488 family)
VAIELGCVIRSSDIYYKTQIIKESTEDSDGLKILISLFRPRYLLKDKRIGMNGRKSLLKADNYEKSISKIKKIEWSKYKIRYINEINKNFQYKQLL